MAAYAFSESTGSIAADSSGTGNAAIMTYTSAWSSDGRYGRGLNLTGANNGITPPASSSLALTGSFTIEAWIKPASNGASHTIVYRPDDLQFIVLANGALYATATFSGGYLALQGSAMVLPWNTWSHVALTYDGAALRLFLNGLEVGSTAGSGSLTSPTYPLQVGGVQYNSPLVGGLDEIRIYARALTASAIALDMLTPVDATLPLEICERHPRPGELGVVSTSVIALFSRPIDGRTLTTTTFTLRDSSGMLVPATVSHDAAGRRATLTPSNALAPLGNYTATLIGGVLGVHDMEGGTLASDVVWTFRTAAAVTAPSASFSLSEMTGLVAGDSSGNGNVATLVNGPTWTTAGRYGSALQFNGVQDGLELPPSDTLAFTNAFTFEAWVRPTSFAATPPIWITPSVNLMISPYGPLFATANLSGGYATLYTSEDLMEPGAWTHVAMTYDGAALRLYVNGVPAITQPATGVLPVVPSPTHIAGPMGGTSFLGTIDEIRLYRRALTEAEVWLDGQTPIDNSLPLRVTDITPPAASIGVVRTAVTATFSRPINASTLTTATFDWRDAANARVPATLTYDAAARTARLSATAALAPLTNFAVRIVGGSRGVHDANGTALASDFTWSFRTAALDTAPAAAFAFSEGTGTTTADCSGNGNAATLFDGATWGAGKYGAGVIGDGIDAAVRLPMSESLLLTNGFTFEAWVNPTNFDMNRHIWLANEGGLILWTNGYLYATSPKDGTAPLWSSMPLALRTWSHVAYSYDGRAVRLYLNGVQVGSTAYSGAIPPFRDPMFLGYPSLSGGIDDVRIYRRGVAAAQIAADMASPLSCGQATPPSHDHCGDDGHDGHDGHDKHDRHYKHDPHDTHDRRDGHDRKHEGSRQAPDRRQSHR